MRNLDAINIDRNPNIPSQFSPPRRPKKRWNRKLKYFLLFLVLVTGTIWGTSQLLSKTNQIFTNQENIFTRVGKLFTSSDRELKGEENGQVNVLLMGMGGPGHEGPLLTDTMLVASVDTETKEVVLISIPRDFVVNSSRSFTKINAIYAFAEVKKENSGGEASIEAVEKLTGLEIPYYAVIDFKGFVKGVDHVNGLDIEIERTFTDSQYPDYKHWYLPPVTFKKGMEHMDGERALIFARSRKGNNGEGSDFARSERQKKILLAFKEKVLALDLTDFKTLNNLFSDFAENFRTNFEPYEIKRLADLAKDIKAENVYSFSLEPQGDLICNGLIGDYENRVFVVQPCEGKDIEDIHTYLANAPLLAKLKKEDATIEVQNSTGKSSALASWRTLANSGLNVKISSTKPKTVYDRTIFYDNSQGLKPKTLEYLQNGFKFTKADIPYSSSTADFVIILGNDSL